MNKQEIFDTAVAALIKQGEPSHDGDSCLYRGPNGTKCAIGHLIPDEKYSPKLEHKNAFQTVVRRAASIRPSQIDLAGDLQDAHDGPASNLLTGTAWLKVFKEGAREVAEKYRLSTKVLEG